MLCTREKTAGLKPTKTASTPNFSSSLSINWQDRWLWSRVNCKKLLAVATLLTCYCVYKRRSEDSWVLLTEWAPYFPKWWKVPVTAATRFSFLGWKTTLEMYYFFCNICFSYKCTSTSHQWRQKGTPYKHKAPREQLVQHQGCTPIPVPASSAWNSSPLAFYFRLPNIFPSFKKTNFDNRSTLVCFWSCRLLRNYCRC